MNVALGHPGTSGRTVYSSLLHRFWIRHQPLDGIILTRHQWKNNQERSNVNSLFAFSYLARGFRVLTKPGVRLYVIIPLLLNFTVFALLIWAGMSYFGGFLDWLMPESDASGLWVALSWLLWTLFFLTAWIIIFYSFTLIANLIAAPFNGLLAEAVEHHLTGQTAPGGLLTALKEFVPSLTAELRKLLYLAGWSIPILILSFVPGVNILAPFVWALFSAWMMGIQYLDYPFANHGVFFKQQRKRLAGHRFATMSFGGVTMLATMVPVLNFIVMPAAVAGATIMWAERLSQAEEE
ncbi:MAG: sulfate transporter CysZ [Gammaproteobacteria bacterium]|nr:sulfate transporter CysZ [Gammaproteobacteria bacterium]